MVAWWFFVRLEMKLADIHTLGRVMRTFDLKRNIFAFSASENRRKLLNCALGMVKSQYE